MDILSVTPKKHTTRVQTPAPLPEPTLKYFDSSELLLYCNCSLNPYYHFIHIKKNNKFNNKGIGKCNNVKLQIKKSYIYAVLKFRKDTLMH